MCIFVDLWVLRVCKDCMIFVFSGITSGAVKVRQNQQKTLKVEGVLSMTYFWYFCIYNVSPLVS